MIYSPALLGVIGALSVWFVVVGILVVVQFDDHPLIVVLVVALIEARHYRQTDDYKKAELLKQEKKQYQRQQKEEERKLSELAKYIANVSKETLTKVGYCHVIKNPRGGQRVQTIQFTHAIVIGRELVILRLGRIPYMRTRYELFADGTNYSNEPSTLQNGRTVVSRYAAELYLALGRQVEISFYEDCGIFFQISLKQGISGVPKRVWWRDPENKEFSMMDGHPMEDGKGGMPDVKKNPETRYYIPVGMAKNRRIIRKDLRSLPHLIVSGTTGSGKTNFLNQMICSLLERNTPKTLRLYLIDLKMVEFAHYQQLLDPTGVSMVATVARNEETAIDVLNLLYEEIVRRQNLLEGTSINIEGWNRTNPHQRLPYIVVIFDELSLVMLSKNKEISQAASRLISKYLAIGRAFGCHMVLCTQAVSSRVVDLLTTANTPGKMIFKAANRQSSINSLGDQRAWTMLDNPGMGFFCDERGAEDMVQTAMILESQRDQVIQRVIGTPEETVTTIQDLCAYALENFDGAMVFNYIWQHFKDRDLSRRKMFEMVQAHYFDEETESPIIDVYGDGRLYCIVPGRGQVSTKVELISFCISENRRSTEPPGEDSV